MWTATLIALVSVTIALAVLALILGIIGLVKKHMALSITGTVLGAASFIMGIIVVWWTLFFAIAGLVCGIIGIVQAAKKNKKTTA